MIDSVWNFHGKDFPHHFIYISCLLHLTLDHITCNVFTAQCLKADCTIIVMYPGPVQLYSALYTPGILWRGPECNGGTRPMPRMSRNGWYVDTGPGHLNQGVAMTQSPGHRTDIGLNGPNLIIVIWPDRPCRDFRHTSNWFLTFSLKWCNNHPKWWCLHWHYIAIVKSRWASSNHLDMIVFHLRWIGRWWGEKAKQKM